MPEQPLAEVFGFPVTNLSERALRYRKNRLCPFNNRVANCTKDKANDPLGVCSIYDTAGAIAITCPVRFRQDWLIADDAASFFFPADSTWTSLIEVRLSDGDGVSAGNIDLVLVSYDEYGRILDFGSLEVQAVYVSGNVRTLFGSYIDDPNGYIARQPSFHSRPRPDYLSSSRKRLVPQLIYKGSILKTWGKKQAVAVHRGFFSTLPALNEVNRSDADIAWLIYDMVLNDNAYHLSLERVVYTLFKPALDQITTPQIGEMDQFMQQLQQKLDEKFDQDNSSLDVNTLNDLL